MRAWRSSHPTSLRSCFTWTRWESSTSWMTALYRAARYSNSATAVRGACPCGWSSSPPPVICRRERSAPASRRWWPRPWINAATGTWLRWWRTRAKWNCAFERDTWCRSPRPSSARASGLEVLLSGPCLTSRGPGRTGWRRWKAEGFNLLSKECYSLTGKQSSAESDAWVLQFGEAEKQASDVGLQEEMPLYSKDSPRPTPRAAGTAAH